MVKQLHYSTKEVVELTGLSPYRIRMLIDRNQFPLPDKHLSNARRNYFRCKDIQAWIASATT
jgi:predicted DNA-binding transcriptional regulator AlpA